MDGSGKIWAFLSWYKTFPLTESFSRSCLFTKVGSCPWSTLISVLPLHAEVPAGAARVQGPGRELRSSLLAGVSRRRGLGWSSLLQSLVGGQPPQSPLRRQVVGEGWWGEPPPLCPRPPSALPYSLLCECRQMLFLTPYLLRDAGRLTPEGN